MPNSVKNTTFPKLLDLLAPHYCRGCERLGEVLCNRCKNNIIASQLQICPNCKAKAKNHRCQKCHTLPPIYLVGERSSLIGNLVHDYKYHSTRALAKPLAEILDKILPNTTNQAVIVPLPTIDRHIRERGLDHTYLIAKHLAKIRGKNYQTSKLLLRAKNTVQVGANRSMRLTQADSAYVVSSKATIDPSTTYILLDDVWTTGASMKAAVKKLRQAGAKDIIIAILALSRLD
ncbi:ComF family protein [Candidatus Saccharibacteria bacterium]|nr:ComF family protein [Candidatus Saccharibacteria bacterium]